MFETYKIHNKMYSANYNVSTVCTYKLAYEHDVIHLSLEDKFCLPMSHAFITKYDRDNTFDFAYKLCLLPVPLIHGKSEHCC